MVPGVAPLLDGMCSVGCVVRGWVRPVDHGADAGLEDMLWSPGSSRCWMACRPDGWVLGPLDAHVNPMGGAWAGVPMLHL